MAKQEMGSNGIECCCLSAGFLSAAMHPTKNFTQIKVVSLLFCCCCGVRCYVKQYTSSASENTIFGYVLCISCSCTDSTGPNANEGI